MLVAELLAEGFRRLECQRGGGRFWHPVLELGIITLEDAPLTQAEASNVLTVQFGAGPSIPPSLDCPSVRVIGIEDLIARHVADWISPGHGGDDAAAQIETLLRLGRAGVGGRLRSGYLQRRLAYETKGEVTLELTSAERSLHDSVPRSTPLSAMGAVIEAWRLACGLSFASRDPRAKSRSGDSSSGQACSKLERDGRPEEVTNVIPFAASLLHIR